MLAAVVLLLGTPMLRIGLHGPLPTVAKAPVESQSAFTAIELGEFAVVLLLSSVPVIVALHPVPLPARDWSVPESAYCSSLFVRPPPSR